MESKNSQTKKIICWIPNMIDFGIAKKISEQNKFKIYSIFDVWENHKQFFKKQNLMDFEKEWFYDDEININKKHKPNLDYLKNIEEKYGFNLWKTYFGEKKLYKYNTFHKFNFDESLSIFEQECKFFEKILDEIQPDTVIMQRIDRHHMHLFTEICKAKKIQVLIFQNTNFAGKCEIFEPTKNYLKEFKKWEVQKEYSKEEILELYSKHNYKGVKEIRQLPSVWERNKKLLKFLIFHNNNKFQNHYQRIGINRKSILKNMISDIIIRKKVHRFLDKIKKHISENESFIYFPLHSEPESVLNIESIYFSNQIEIIKHIAKSIPVSHVLYVKEHPIAVQKNARNILFYKEILEIPNVKLFHPLASQNEFLEKCSMVITITGTSGLEGILHDKPVIVFSNPRYSILPFVTIVKKNEELAKIISKKMELKTDFESLSKFVDFTINDSFNLDLIKLAVAQTERFYEIGVVALDKTITTKKVENFINEFSEEFNEIAENYKQKINF